MVPERQMHYALIQCRSATWLPLHDMRVQAVGFLLHSNLASSVRMTRCTEVWRGSPWRGTTQGPKSRCWCTFLMACHPGGSQQRSDLGSQKRAAGLATTAADAGHGSACTIQLTSTALCTADMWMSTRHAQVPPEVLLVLPHWVTPACTPATLTANGQWLSLSPQMSSQVMCRHYQHRHNFSVDVSVKGSLECNQDCKLCRQEVPCSRTCRSAEPELMHMMGTCCWVQLLAHVSQITEAVMPCKLHGCYPCCVWLKRWI